MGQPRKINPPQPHTPEPFTLKQTLDDQGYPVFYLMAGTETLSTIHHLGKDRNREWISNARLFRAAPDLLKACEALHDALSAILEDCASADREGEIQHVHGNEYEIGRGHRAQALQAIRKSFKALVKAKGAP